MALLHTLVERDKYLTRPPGRVRYLSLAEALLVAEAVTVIDARTLSRASRVDLLDSALHAAGGVR